MAASSSLSRLHIVHGVLNLNVGGLERMVLSLASTQRSHGHEVTILCIEAAGDLESVAQELGLRVIALCKPSGRQPEWIHQACTQLHRLSPDVLHTHQIGASWYLAQAARRFRIPVIHTEHGNGIARSSGFLARLKARLFIHLTSEFTDRFCCVSEEIASTLSRWRTVSPAKLEIMANGISSADASVLRPREEMLKSLKIDENALILGTVGRLAEVKRQDLLIRAFAEVSDEFPSLHLVLVGEGSERANLEALVAQLRLQHRVTFAGYQPKPEALLRCFNIFALSSDSEGFPLSLLEAMQAGVPAVATSVGAIPQILADPITGLLVPPNDVHALSAAIRTLLLQPELARSIGEAGKQLVLKKYSLAAIANQYEARYREWIRLKSQ